MFTLGQQLQPKGDILPVVLWLGILIVITVVAGLVVLALRKRILGRPTEGSDEGSLMDALRGMRDRGEMTSEEFEATRRAMIGRLRGDRASPGPPSKPTGAPRPPTRG